jgi:hypothetical protein
MLRLILAREDNHKNSFWYVSLDIIKELCNNLVEDHGLEKETTLDKKNIVCFFVFILYPVYLFSLFYDPLFNY